MFKLICIISAGLLLVAFTNNNERNGELPNNPKAGECYTRVLVPPIFDYTKETIMVKPETFAIKAQPAKYEFVNKKILVEDAYTKTVVIPAKYKLVKTKVLVKQSERKLLPTPANFKTLTKKILVTEARTIWKKGSGPIQRVDNSTGEILCYTKVPAVYKTVKENILVKEASVREQIIPAEYKIIKRRELVEPEKVLQKNIAAVYKTVKVKSLIQSATQSKIDIPAKYKTINKKIQTRGSFSEWRPILCNTNASRGSIRDVQARLAKIGFYKGPVDGIYGKQTSKAVLGFQSKNRLASGGLTKETLSKLKVRWPSKVSSL